MNALRPLRHGIAGFVIRIITTVVVLWIISSATQDQSATAQSFPASTPAPPTVTPTPAATPPMPKDYTTEEFKRLLDLKGLCGSGDGEYEARELAEVWLEDREKFNYKVGKGVYGKHWDRTDEYSVDKRKLILGLRHAISEMERVCLSL